MHVKPHDSTEDFGLRGLEFLAHDDLEDHIKISKASHIYIHTQNSVLHQKLLPNAEFHYLRSKRGRVLAQGLKYETECLRESDGLGIMPSKYDDSETHLGFPWSDNPWIDYTNPFSQPHKSADIKIVMNPSEFLAVDSGPVNSSQSQVASKPAKRSRDDSGQVQVEQLGEHASSQSLSRKRPRLEEDSGGFACPFYKKDPWKFHLCLNYKLSKICYVKQHLSRYHNDASKYCPICHRQFNDEIERGSHILAKDCQQSQSTFHVMTADQKKDIHLAAGRKISVEEKWYQIWTILFPCAKRPDSPYVKGHVFAEALSSIRAFCRGPGAHIVTQTFRQANYHGLTDHDLFDEILSQIESQALTHSPEPPSTLHLDDGIDTECTDSLNVSTSPDSHSANSINSVLDSPSMVITGDYGLVIPHLLPISNDGQEALGSSSETLLCDLEAGSDHFEYDSAGAGELFDLAEPGFSYKLSRPRDGYDSESCADNDDFLDILAFPGSPGGVTI
ncbi:hypothetical protein E0Z10_g1881 [Xylaria hypoxylon]|uniref:C2H2-type domain-containing protein n=1 Tax=Xylaria hypoxylon TaxID=37992 RepID=A0A4Z0Z5A5_9PEZI|nr:hypothetical protein E0Z10_g1881 [Xylaria hypoxylon]